MHIPVVSLTDVLGNIVGSVVYITGCNIFKDSRKIYSGLPLQNYMDCKILCNNLATIVGRDETTHNYIVCFGDNMLHSLTKAQLLNYKLTNAKLDKMGRVICNFGRPENLANLFPDHNISFVNSYSFEQASSLGVAKKFFATYKGLPCIVKFTKLNNKDIENELIYYNIGRLLNVKVCRVIKTVYFNKPCVVSIFEYTKGVSSFVSFRSSGISTSDLYKNFSDSDKMEFDKMLILDYLLHQQDRHLSNLALLNNKPYPLFDNGECLGIGVICNYSMKFRQYVTSLNREYIRSLFNITPFIYKSIIEELSTTNNIEIFKLNYLSLFKERK